PLTTDIFTLSLHDALPIFENSRAPRYLTSSLSGNSMALVWDDGQAVRYDPDTGEVKELFPPNEQLPWSYFCSDSALLRFKDSGTDRKSTRLNSSHSQISYA